MSRAGALEYHIKRYQQSQHAVLAFVRAFIDAHEEYEQEYGKLAAYCQSFAKRKTDESLLDDVVQDLENAITTCANSHTTLVDELKRFVLRSLETVISQDQQQIKRRHSDIKAALQRDKVHRRHLLFVMTRQGSPMSGGGLVRLFQRQLSSSVLDNQASNSHDNDGSRLKQLMELRSRCYHERSECYRHLDSLTVNHEQYELSVRALLVRFMKALGQYSETTCAAIKRGRINSHVQQSETQVQAYEGFVGHIETMTWMISSFSQLISMEESITKRLQRFVKAHCSSIVDSVSLLEQFVEYQKLLALTLADPICRTLKCSKQKCEAIERELLQAIEKTQKSLRASQGKLTVQEARWKQRRAMLERSADDAAISLSFAGSFDAALRSAWDRLGSPRMKLPKSRSMNSAGMAMAISEGKTDEQLLLIESEITKTKELINTLEKTLADQKSEMTTILAETSTIGVKTMKLMVDDYQKKVTTALQSVNTALKASNETMAFVLLAQGIAFRTCVAFADDNLSGIILDDKPEYEATEEDKPETGIDIEVGSKDVHETTNQVDSDQPLTRTIETWWTPLPSQPDHILPTKLDASVDNESATFVPFGAAVADKRNGNCAVLAFSFLILLWVFVTVAKLNALDSGWSELQSVQAGNAQRLADLRNLLR